jgi:hypothetical protein
MKATNPNLAMWLNCWRRGVFKGAEEVVFILFLFVVCFVVLQVIARGSW